MSVIGVKPYEGRMDSNKKDNKEHDTPPAIDKNPIKMTEQDLANFPDEALPEKVEEMYHLLVNITQELSRIKILLKKKELNEDGGGHNYESIIQNELIANNISINLLDKSPEKSTDKNLFDEDSKSELSTTFLDIPKNPNDAFGNQSISNTDYYVTGEASLHPPSPFLIVANKVLKGPVILNVGGKRHEVRWNTLDKYPTSRLGRLRHCVTHRGLQHLCDAYSLERREYYFDRSPRNFDAILCLYRTGKLHLSQGVCVQDFCEELEYWGLDDLHMEPCCQHTYYRARWLLPTAEKEEKEEDFGSGCCAPTQRHLWNLFENPHHSFAAKVVAVVSCLFVVVSTLCLIISTLPSFQQKDENGIVHEETFFEVAEAVFVGWFTFEYFIRFIAAPRKLRFLKAAMNVIDLLGILPYFMSMSISFITTSGGIKEQAKYQDEMRRIAQIFRIMRILRIFKLARHITGLQTLGMTLRNSYKELGLLMLVVIMGMLIFSGLAYVSEKDEEDTMFISMPQALYWAIITMTSVGYGDISPTTWFGKLVGSACAICGVLCISLPIPIIVNNFNKFYEKAKIEEEILLKKKKASWEDAKRGVFQNINESFEQLNSTKYLYDIMHHQNGANFEELMNMRRISSVTGKVTQLNEQNNTKSQELTNSSSLEHNKSPPNFEFRNNKDHLMNSAGNNEHHVINSGPDHLIITGVGGGVGERHHHHAINKDLDMLAGAGGIQHRNSLNGINETPLVNNFTHCKKNNESCPSFDKLKD